MKNPDKCLGAGLNALPAGEPPQLGKPRQTTDNRRHRLIRPNYPHRQRDERHRQDDHIRRAEQRRQSHSTALCQPVAGKAGHDPPTDQCNHQDRRRESRSKPRTTRRKAALRRVQMKSGIGQDPADQQHQHRQVAPVVPRDDLARQKEGQCQRQSQIDQCDDQPGQECRHRYCTPSQPPERHKTQQRPAADRQAARPVRHRRQQESGHHCAEIAKEHLVRVPGDGIERRRQHVVPGKHHHPEHHRQRRPDGARQKERPKSEAQHCRTGPGPYAFGRCGHG